MWYWNQQNFEGLIAVADSITNRPNWNGYEQYCRLREQGLRPQALQSIREFISDTEHWDELDRRQFADWIFSTSLRNPAVHQLIPANLNQQLLIPTLRQWASSDSRDATPERWLGFAAADCQHFKNALSLNFADDVSRYQLVLRDVDDVDYQCHHLPDYFIGEIGTAIDTLDRARKMAAGFSNPDIAPKLEIEFDRLYDLVGDWKLFQTTDSTSFADWCVANGREYQWQRTYYYKT